MTDGYTPFELTDPRDAEIAALRAENERLRDLGVQETSDRIGAEQRAEEAEARVAKLEAALRECIGYIGPCDHGCPGPGNCILCDARAALAPAEPAHCDGVPGFGYCPNPELPHNPAPEPCGTCRGYRRVMNDPGPDVTEITRPCPDCQPPAEEAHDA